MANRPDNILRKNGRDLSHWIREDYIIKCDGKVIDLNLIYEKIIELAEKFNIINITYDKYNAVVIRAVCGFTSQTNVPENIKTGMLLFIGHLDTNREATSEKTLTEIPFGVKALWDMERVYQFK
jgi:hypothetical protein